MFCAWADLLIAFKIVSNVEIVLFSGATIVLEILQDKPMNLSGYEITDVILSPEECRRR